MPDPTRQTISGTQSPALFGKSPYLTEWMLYHWASNNADLADPDNERVAWGQKLERVILDAAADEIRAQVHDVQEYIRLPAYGLGATVETLAFTDEGVGVIEAKNVDWKVWKENWTETAAPPHIEMQLQHEMLVGRGEGMPAKWGAIAALVGGNDLRLYRRLPDPGFAKQLIERSLKFWQDVQLGLEPPVRGRPIEVPMINAIWPPEEQTIEPLRVNDPRWVTIADEYQHKSTMAKSCEKTAAELKAKLLGLAQDHAVVVLPDGRRIRIRKTHVPASISERKAHVRTEIKMGGSDV